MITDYAAVARYIAHFEGFSSKAYWDVNAWRIGYGSDTRTKDQIKVKEGDIESVSDALANLAMRIPQYEQIIIRQVTLESWDRLSQPVRMALLDFAYNYGSLTQTLAQNIQIKAPIATISAAVEARRVDDRGINSSRRIAEAGTILAAI